MLTCRTFIYIVCVTPSHLKRAYCAKYKVSDGCYDDDDDDDGGGGGDYGNDDYDYNYDGSSVTKLKRLASTRKRDRGAIHAARAAAASVSSPHDALLRNHFSVHQEARAGCSTGQSQLLQSLQLSAQTTRERSPPSSKHQDRQSSVASPRVLHFDASEQHQQPHQEHHLQPHLSRTDGTRKVSAVVPPRWKQQNFHYQLQSSNGRHHGPGSSIAGGYLC